jgi:hypothetical protein
MERSEIRDRLYWFLRRTRIALRSIQATLAAPAAGPSVAQRQAGPAAT